MRMTQTEVALYQQKHTKLYGGPTTEQRRTAQELKDERVFHGAIMGYLRLMGVKGVVHSRMDRKSTQACGVPDFLFAIKGQAVAIEAKVAGRQPTPEQIGWLEALRQDGWLTTVVRSLDDVIAIYQQASQAR